MALLPCTANRYNMLGYLATALGSIAVGFVSTHLTSNLYLSSLTTYRCGLGGGLERGSRTCPAPDQALALYGTHISVAHPQKKALALALLQCSAGQRNKAALMTCLT